MEPCRLILAPQLRVHLRYQEWWWPEFVRNLSPHFSEVVVLGELYDGVGRAEDPSHVSSAQAAMALEADQIDEYMSLDLQDSDVLLHCDISYPGIFHNVLAHKRPKRCAVFAHATAVNHLDMFEDIPWKWTVERANMRAYDKVFVATHYHRRKIENHAGFFPPNITVLGGLPNPPKDILPGRWNEGFPGPNRFGSVARNNPQKRTKEVEELLPIARHPPTTWERYYHFLDCCRYLVVTAKEETYGYGVVDAILRGCTPIAPRAYSYPELLPDDYLYDPSGAPGEVAEKIQEVAARLDRIDAPARLLTTTQAAIDGFWDRLAKELKS